MVENTEIDPSDEDYMNVEYNNVEIDGNKPIYYFTWIKYLSKLIIVQLTKYCERTLICNRCLRHHLLYMPIWRVYSSEFKVIK